MDRLTQKANQNIVPIQPIQALSYDVQLTDNRTIIAMMENVGCTVTLPATLPQGFFVSVLQFGAGQVNAQGDAGATLVSPNGTFTTSAQYASLSCMVVSNPDGQSANWIVSEGMAI
jgi:hypothetical protein